MEKITVKFLAEQIQKSGKTHFSGRLEIQATEQQTWHLYFHLGRLVWATGGLNRFRRWYRLTGQICPDLDRRKILLRNENVPLHWEYLVLSALLKRDRITREQAIAIAEQSLSEVLFDLIQGIETNLESVLHWAPQNGLGEPFTFFNALQLMSEVWKRWQQWCQAGLAQHSPNLAPVIKQLDALQQQVSANVFRVLKRLVDGNSTFRDLAFAMKQDELTVTRSLVAYAQRGLIGLQYLSDEDLEPKPKLASSKAQPRSGLISSSLKGSQDLPLIVCIDDSPHVCAMMERFLEQAGYRCLTIQDSVQSLPTLLEQRPDLIFLDLVMPVASGYEICAQIRRVNLLKETPVIILTGNDGIVDRVRAKMVGASGFLGKPIEFDKVLATIRQHLSKSSSSPDSTPKSQNQSPQIQASSITEAKDLGWGKTPALGYINLSTSSEAGS